MTTAICKPVSSFPLKPLAAAVLLVCSANLHAAPILDRTFGNNLEIDVSMPGTTVITQTANQRDVIDWREFSIDVNETVRFDQPDINSVIVNRVNGGIRSDIFGSLIANGRIFLINPSGIVFGANSSVNVNGLVASTLGTRNGAAATNETVEFTAAPDAGAIVNEGSITAKDIVLLAPSITNTGNLNANGVDATISLIAAGVAAVNTVDGNLRAQVLEPGDTALIEQLGQMLAEGGRIVLLASADNNGAPSVINTAGVNQASEISIQGDLVQLTGRFNPTNTQGVVAVQAGVVSQSSSDTSQTLEVGGALNVVADRVDLNNSGNDFVGRVDLDVGGVASIQDSNDLLISGVIDDSITLNAENIMMSGQIGQDLNATASNRITQDASVQVSGQTALTANQIILGEPANSFDGAVRINSTGSTTMHANGGLNISGSAGALELTAGQINQHGALIVGGGSVLQANQLELDESENDFGGNVVLAVTGNATLNDKNDLSVSGSSGSTNLTALANTQLNGLSAQSLVINAGSVSQTAALNVQQTTRLNAANVALADQSNTFGGNVSLENVANAELSGEDTLTLSGQVGTLLATAANINQSAEASPLIVNNTATLNGGNVELLQAGNLFSGDVVLNVDGHAQMGTAGTLVVSGRAGSVTLNADSVRQGVDETDALNVQGQIQINNSNSVELMNSENQLGSAVVLQNVDEVKLNSNNALLVEGTAGDVNLTTGAAGQLTLNGLDANSLTANSARIDQTDFLTVTGASNLNAQNIDLTTSDRNQFGGVVNVTSGESAAIKASGSLTLNGNVATGEFEADSLVFNGLNTSNGLSMSAGSITQSMDVDRALQVQGETRINHSGAVTLDNTLNNFAGNVVTNTQGAVRLSDLNTLTIEGLAGSLELTAQEIVQSRAVEVNNSTSLSAGTIDLNDPANDFRGQVTLVGAGQTALRDSNNLSIAGNVESLNAIADTVEIDNSLTVNQNLGLTADHVTQATSGAAVLSVGGRTQIEHINNSGIATVRLNNANNDFVGAVSLNEQVNVELRDRNTLTLEGSAGKLTASAAEIKQSAGLVVSDQATLVAGDVDLQNNTNDFQGLVDLNVTGNTDLFDSNELRVAGTVNEATFGSVTLTFDGMAAVGDVTFNSSTIGQNGALAASGVTTFNGDSVTLENSGNTFNDTVNLNLSGAAVINANGGLTVAGKASDVSASANALAVSSLDANNIVLQADQLALNNFATEGNLTLNGGNVIQQGALQVGGTTTLGASNVTLQNEANDFAGAVILNSAGNVNLRDQEALTLQGSASSLTVQAGTEVNQSAELSISGSSRLTAPVINLGDVVNNFGDVVTVNSTGQSTLGASGNLLVGGSAEALRATVQNELQLAGSDLGSLDATAQQITQSGVVNVAGTSNLLAERVALSNSNNDFSGSLHLDVTGQASVADRNDLSVQGRALNLTSNVAGTLTAEAVEIASGTLQAGEILLNQLRVSDSAELRANRISQTVSTQSGGTLTMRANEVDLALNGNDFSGELVLQNVDSATVHDTNQLVLSGRANTLAVVAQRITQRGEPSGAVIVQGGTQLQADQVDLQNAANNFGGAVTLQVSDAANLSDVNNLVLQGDVGSLTVKAAQLSQSDSLTVRGDARVEATSVQLDNAANDFQNEVNLNVSGATVVADSNELIVSGQVNGTAELQAESIGQRRGLSSNADLLLQANRIELGNQDNNLNGLVRLAGTSEAMLSSQGTLRVQGNNLGGLDLQAQEVSLGELGELQRLAVNADELRQTAALNVTGTTNLRGGKIELNNSGNDFAGQLTVQDNGTGIATVSIADENNLSMQGDNLVLSAQVQGDFDLQANNVELAGVQVDGASRIDLNGSLTQSRAVNLTNAVLKASQIDLSNSGNRFNGNTQVESSGSVALGTNTDLTVNTTTSTGTLALTVGGDAVVGGMQVRFADSRVAGALAVSGNQISQTGGLQVQGDSAFEALGGVVDLQHAGNRFQGRVSASAEQTRLATAGDMQLLNLNSRGGQLTADGRMLLLGNVEQTGGALTFTARGISRPLSSAEIALLLPPSLDVFSSKEAVNPFTGLGRITLTSPMIHQRSGQLVTAAGSTTQFNSPENGSVILTQNNQINGQVGVLAGQNYGQSFAYAADRGASLFAINNDVRLNVGGRGAEADVIAIRARGLATQGGDAVIHARMPYNDTAVGTARSYAGLTLSIPLGGPSGQPGGLATFGESAGSGQSPGAGAIRVEVGDLSRPGLGGFLTVLPFEGSNLLPGQVVYLAGPERKGTQAFFYDGARSLDRIPVVYNGTLLLSPQENAALTTAQGAVVLARQEQTRSVVRTENVAGKIINGVVAEVGPGRPATEGEGGAGKPATCDAEDSGLGCAP